jgi:hypothetical protein
MNLFPYSLVMGNLANKEDPDLHQIPCMSMAKYIQTGQANDECMIRVEHHLGEVNFYLDNAYPSFQRGKEGPGFNWINNAFSSLKEQTKASLLWLKDPEMMSQLYLLPESSLHPK